MTILNTNRSIIAALETRGLVGRIISIQCLDAIKDEIQTNYNKGILSGIFYHERLSHFQYAVPASRSRIHSIIITSAPQPLRRVRFQYKGRQFKVIVPPTYSYETDKMVEKIILDIISKRGFKLYPVSLPLKLLAAYTGLVQYGKNNVTYIGKIGSYHRLAAFYSDIPVDDNNWGGYTLLENCNNCTSCLKACPTGAILSDRFIIRAEKCITFHNERSNRFPDWIEDSWHNCLIGCMTCQLICPANKRVKNWIEDSVSFNKKETSLILNGDRNHLPEKTVKKLQKLDLYEDFDLLPRNLQVLLTNK